MEVVMRPLLAVVAVLLASGPLFAQGWIEPRPLPGLRPGDVVKERSSVRVRVVDRIAHVEVEEWFRNSGGGLAEGDYLYPMAGETAFAGLSLFQGDEELRGETLDAGTARSIYEEIVRRQRDPALVELVGHGLLRARVFPIGAGETRRITLRYTQRLDRAGDALRFRYLGCVAGGRGCAVPTASEFEVVVEDGAVYRDPTSPTHVVGVRRDAGRMVVRPSAPVRGDFALFLPMTGPRVGISLATHRPTGGEPGYFMLSLSPGAVASAMIPRDVTVVLDVSGSMAGGKMEEARRALHQLLGSLDRHDRFRLIAFSGAVEAERETWSPTTVDDVARARRWVDGLRAEGSTNIGGALDEAFRLESPAARLPIVVFLTDGLPTAGETSPERIAERVEQRRGEARIFAFGIGYDVNTYLLDRLGAAGRGATGYVHPGEDLETAIGSLAAKIRHPVLTDLAIGESAVRLSEIYPRELPDLFAGEDLVLFGRYDGQTLRPATVTVTGRRNGKVERYSTEASFRNGTGRGAEAGGASRSDEYIARLWASRKVGALVQQVRLGGPDPEIVEEIRRTALRYGILTEYTSYLVLEPGAMTGTRSNRAVPIDAHTGSSPRPISPRPASGRDAVIAAEQAKLQRNASSVAGMVAAEAGAVMPSAAGTGAEGRAEIRVVAGRRFVLSEGIWTDLAHPAGQRIVIIEPFSEAYFGLLAAAPELRAGWSAFDRVLVAGSGISLKVAPGGVTSMPDMEKERLLREFRGR